MNQLAPASTFSAVDFRTPCGPSRISMWSALAAGLHDAGDGRDHPQRAEGAVERRVVGAEIGHRPGVEPRHAVPGEAVRVVAHRVDADVARHGDDAAADDDGRDVDLAPLQPFGAAHVVRVAPGPRQRAAAGSQGRAAGDHDLLAELVEHQRAGESLVEESAVMTLASLRSGVPPGSRRSWLAQRGRIGALVDVAGGVQRGGAARRSASPGSRRRCRWRS